MFCLARPALGEVPDRIWQQQVEMAGLDVEETLRGTESSSLICLLAEECICRLCILSFLDAVSSHVERVALLYVD